jgi:hypothetical protein
MHMPERNWATSRAAGCQAANAQPAAMPTPRAGQAKESEEIGRLLGEDLPDPARKPATTG